MPTTATYTRPFHLTDSSDSTFEPSKPLIIKKTENLRPFTYFAYTTNYSVENITDFGTSDTSSDDEGVGMNHVSKVHIFGRIKALFEGLRPMFKCLKKLTLSAANTPHPSRRQSP